MMPISEEDLRKPRWIQTPTEATMSFDDNERFLKFETMPRSYRDGKFLLPGYNPHHNTTSVEIIDVNKDDLSFRPE